MKRGMKRVLISAIAILLGLALLTGLAGWAFLSSWIPVHGKTRLIQVLERSGTIQVTIGAVRYHPLQGFIVEDLRITDRRSNTLQGVVPSLTAQVSWLPLLATRTVVFRARATVERPARTLVHLAGRYHLRRDRLSLEVVTTDIPLRSLSAPLASFVPAQLTDGTLRAALHWIQSPTERPTLTGKIDGVGLVWAMPTWRVTGDLAVEGTATPPAQGARGTFLAHAVLRRATLTGVPVAGTITALDGDATLTPDRVEVLRLQGSALGSPWTAEGRIQLGPAPTLDAFATSHAELARLAAAFPDAAKRWQP